MLNVLPFVTKDNSSIAWGGLEVWGEKEEQEGEKRAMVEEEKDMITKKWSQRHDHKEMMKRYTHKC